MSEASPSGASDAGDDGVLFEARAAGGVPPYAVRLPAFEGPLDLLLHLIRINEVEITDIPIARIGEQYVEYLEMMRELDLDVAGEYLLMAATLAWIKSRMLLPPAETPDEAEALDPRAELVARLLEYQRFKQAAGEIGERPLLGRDVFPARAPEPEPPPESERQIEVGLFELLEAYRRALRAAGPSGEPHEIEAEVITVRERMLAVMGVLELRAAVDFDQLFAELRGARPSRVLVVATFLAILELTRLAALALYQGLNEVGVPVGPIHLRRVAEPGDASWVGRISELM